MEGDTIMRIGEIANKFYFLKKGKVEIIANDHISTIAVLDEGSYFGEIGLLLTRKVTVEVKAMTNCILACLDKSKFDMILDLFPDQKKFLKMVILI